MVTILEPRVDVKVEPALPPKDLPPEAVAQEWGYMMPLAGVKYYSFRSRPAPQTESRQSLAPSPKRLSAELIDERVILL